MNEELMFDKVFAKRGVICFFLVVLLFTTCVLRIAVIANGDYKAAQSTQSSYRISVGRQRSSIYDCNKIPLTNNTVVTVAAVLPTEKGIEDISSILYGEKLENALNSLKNGKCAVCEVKKRIDSEAISYTDIYYTENVIAEHIIGYTDSSGHGVCGIQSAYDELLYSDKYVNALYSVSANGDILNGVKPYFENDLSVINDGVITTVDVNIQNIVNNVSTDIIKGAVIVADAKNGKIRALKSLPSFDLNDISSSLNDENSPLLNRCMQSYNVGSVFKPCVAAAALENGRGGYCYNCVGYSHIIDRNFRCHKLDGHGFVDLKRGLAFSCNTYFYNLGITVGKDAIHKTASVLSFGSKLKIGKNMYTDSGNLTSLKELENDAMLANFCIGQGDLLLTPVSMLTLYCAIANDGCYYVPSVIEGIIKDGKETPYDYGKMTRVMSKKNANTVKDYLSAVLEEGTGTSAKPETVTAAGKTATAQTGRFYNNGTEITNSWFCGIFPKENPKYVVVVMSEGQSNTVCNTVFKRIADKVTEMYK